jgi:hypothetical protein
LDILGAVNYSARRFRHSTGCVSKCSRCAGAGWTESVSIRKHESMSCASGPSTHSILSFAARGPFLRAALDISWADNAASHPPPGSGHGAPRISAAAGQSLWRGSSRCQPLEYSAQDHAAAADCCGVTELAEWCRVGRGMSCHKEWAIWVGIALEGNHRVRSILEL